MNHLEREREYEREKERERETPNNEFIQRNYVQRSLRKWIYQIIGLKSTKETQKYKYMGFSIAKT